MIYATSTLQVRNMPAALHRRLKARAALEGVSMSQFVLREIERALERPTRRDLLAAIGEQPEIVMDRSPAEVLREERNSR